MKKIYQLSPNIIAKIAAGEVIERPAYAVKELIENAIDAKAKCITIQITGAGLKKIVVTDDGEGMSKEDIEECFKPHTTSKIVEEEQLIGIKSLGFRGEALSSIAAISNMTIKSRVEKEIGGTVVHIQSGKLLKISPVGMPSGTSVIVDNIFFTVPARKKFLKSIRTEFRNIVDIVMQYAIAFPHIGFFLSHDKRIILDFPSHQDMLERIAMLLGKDVFEQLLPVSYRDSYIHISGFVSRPQITTQNNIKHFLFVNNRSVVNKDITLIIKEAYGDLLGINSYPIFLLFLSLPYELVDVNVHPRKELVSFFNTKLVLEQVFIAISQVLSEHNLTFQSAWENELSIRDNTSSRFGNTESFTGKLLKHTVLPWQVKTEVISTSEITQLHDVYLITQTEQGVLFIDQHAAHERILFEQFRKAFHDEKNKQEVFTLPQTISFDVSLSDAELLKDYLDFFSSLGFTVEYFRDTSFTLSTVPTLFKDRNVIKIITELIEDIRQEKKIKDIDKQTQKMIAYIACRTAIKAGDKLSQKEAKRLIQELERTQNNTTCPHGRPTKIEITKENLDKMFKRK